MRVCVCWVLAADSGPAELRFGSVGTLNGRSLDLVVVAQPGTYSSDGSGCSGQFGKISMNVGSEATFEMSFRDSDTDAIVTLPSFYFSFFDLECARNE